MDTQNTISEEDADYLALLESQIVSSRTNPAITRSQFLRIVHDALHAAYERCHVTAQRQVDQERLAKEEQTPISCPD